MVYRFHRKVSPGLFVGGRIYFSFVYFTKSFVRNKLLMIARCGTIQLFSCEITSGRICFTRFARIFVFYNLYIMMR